MLTVQERTTLRERCSLLNLQGLERLAVHCARENRPDAARYVRDLIAERGIAERANAVPFEVAGQRRRESAPVPDGPRIVYQPYWNSERVRYAVAAIAGISGFGAAIYFVIIPAAVALFSAVVSVVSVVAPYVAGGILAVIALRECFFGEKKTGYFPAENPARSSGGNVYNVYVGEGQVHVHSAEK